MSRYCGRPSCLGQGLHLKKDCPARKKKNDERRAERERSRTDFHKDPGSGHARCGVCGGLARVATNADGMPLGFERHRAPGMNAWCRNGTQPIQKPTGKGSKSIRRSVRTVRGGLPTLGKR